MSPDQVIAAVTALLSVEQDPAFDPLRAGEHDTRYPVTIEECVRPMPAFEVEGATVICGRIAVPEDHQTDNGNKIDLAFAVLKSFSLSPAPDPVVYLHGGPGGSAVDNLDLSTSVFNFLRDRRDIVLFDQRAGGLSDGTVT